MGRVRRVLVVGAGGHGKVVADLLRSLGEHVVGFADRDSTRVGSTVAGAEIIMSQAELDRVLDRPTLNARVFDAIALAVGDNSVRMALYHQIDAALMPPWIHPSAVVSPSASIGYAAVIMPLAAVNAASAVGGAVIINTGAIVEHDCILADGVHVSPRAVLAGGVIVGERSWIGAGATIMPGVRIGADAVVGAGAAVVRDVPTGTLALGVPATTRPRT